MQTLSILRVHSLLITQATILFKVWTHPFNTNKNKTSDTRHMVQGTHNRIITDWNISITNDVTTVTQWKNNNNLKPPPPILIVREETCCHHIGYSFRLAARVLLYAPSHWQDSTYHRLCYTSRGALAGTRNSSMGPPHEGSIRWPIAPWVNALTTELHLAPTTLPSPPHGPFLDVVRGLVCVSDPESYARGSFGFC